MIGVEWSTPAAGERAYQQDRPHDCVPDFRKAEEIERLGRINRSLPVLMSADNPTGWKLEELLERVYRELGFKQLKLTAPAEFTPDADGTRRMQVRTRVREANEQIAACIGQALHHQRQIVALLDTLGPDQGPSGKARV